MGREPLLLPQRPQRSLQQLRDGVQGGAGGRAPDLVALEGPYPVSVAAVAHHGVPILARAQQEVAVCRDGPGRGGRACVGGRDSDWTDGWGRCAVAAWQAQVEQGSGACMRVRAGGNGMHDSTHV